MCLTRPLAILLFTMTALAMFAVDTRAERAMTDVITLDRYPVSIEYASDHRRVADKVASICVDAIPRLSGELGHSSVEPFRVLLVPDMEHFEREQGIRLPSWGVAFALMDNQIMLVDVKRATTAWNTLEKVIPHELSHLLLAQTVGEPRLPLWFVEGLAVWQAREWSLFDNWRLMEAVWTNRAPGLWQITTSMGRDEVTVRTAYRVAYSGIVERFDGDTARVPAFLDEVVRVGEFGRAFESFFGEREFDYYERFSRQLHQKYKSRLLLFQAGPLFSIVALLFLFVLVRIQIRNRRKLKQMEEADRGMWFDER